jgi:apolipoprotein N-acyltransferase
MRLPRSDWVLIAVGAGLLTLAYPPFHLVVPAFVCLVPAALLILRGSEDPHAWRRHLHQGFWYGTITHGALLYWLAGALWQRGHSSIVLYFVAAVMFGGANAVMFAVVGEGVGGSKGRLLVALPAGVVFLEWLAAQVGPIGFPWHQVALTVTATPVLLQTADLAGAGGLGFLLVMTNVLVAMAWWTRDVRNDALRHVESAVALVFLMALYGLYRLQTLPMVAGAEVAVVQPNVTVDEKWVPEHQDAVVERTARLTERALSDARPRFVAWPETALPDAVESHPRWTTRLIQLAHVSGITILTGGVEVVASPQESPRRYNAAFVFPVPGRTTTSVVYRKRKLTPMVEWVPRRAPDLSRAGFGSFTPGRSQATEEASIGRFAILICYELTFADLARQGRLDGAEVLVILSNDAWFGRTSAPYQHFAHATLRAVENRVAVVRAANTGVSGIVDPLGRVVTQTEPFVETYAIGRVQRSDTVPPATYLAEFFGPLSLGLLLTLLIATRGARREPSTTRGWS